jgi:anti-anti-sigma regulatory factor
MDCAGLRVLAGFAAGKDSVRVPLAVTPGPPQVQKLFELTGIGSLLSVVSPSTALSQIAA